MNPPEVVAVLAGLVVLAAGLACRPAPQRRAPDAASASGTTSGTNDRTGGDRPAAHHADEQAIVLLDTMYAELRSGAAYTTALLVALDRAPQALPGLHTQLRRGVPVPVALASSVLSEPPRSTPRRHSRVATSTLVLLAATLDAAYRAGPGAPATVLGAAEVLRERRAWRLERRAQSASARLSARLLTALPPVVAGWSLLSDERVRIAYTTSAVPMVCAVLGLVLNLLGWWWTRRLVAGAA